MTGEPCERKPWTSSGELPPTQTVAPKFSRSVAGFTAEVLMPHEGSATRSGSADFGGFFTVGALGSEGSCLACRSPGGGPPGHSMAAAGPG